MIQEIFPLLIHANFSVIELHLLNSVMKFRDF